ncbi:MAG TPA: TolC family protein [Blastocatellia bacterium]|nr:TolC family protein [Blastocatellia bacterium]
MNFRFSRMFILAWALALPAGVAVGQAAKTAPRGWPARAQNDVAKAKADVVAAATDYKQSLERVLRFQSDDVKAAAERLDKRKPQFEQGIISRVELEGAERALGDAQWKLQQTQRQIAEADALIAEAKAFEESTRLPVGGFTTTAALIRFNGPVHWTLADAAKVESFYSTKFGHALPISAYGQTPVHERLGFDHHNAIDVAVHPDGPEGQAIISYLRSNGIPFIAFRFAVPGSATGAHIHIGSPSPKR